MKNLSKRFLFTILFLSISNYLFSQSTKSLFQEGDRLFKVEHYRNALPFLQKVIEAEPNNSEAVFEAGVCYLHRYSKEKALEYLLKSYTLDPNVSKYIHYWLGRAYHQNYQYDKAIQEYNNYKDNFTKGDQRRKDVEKHIEQTNYARQLSSNAENFKVSNLGSAINTIYSEHSPVTSKDDSLLFFTSRRQNPNGGKEDLDGEFFEDIFQSKKQTNGQWTAPEHIHLNTSGHDASIQLFDNDTRLLLYRESKGGDIFVTEREQGKEDSWKDPEKFADINTSDFEADAFITADGKTAYFATNHYKKVGDLDIYYITKDANGKWSKPQELTGRINTSEDEDAPFLSVDGKTLYFSSRGHKNMGGFDVFKSTLDNDGNWTQPVNMGFPINTPDDDVYYYMSASGKKGFLSSYREGGFGEKDIYEILPIPPVEIVCLLNSCDAKRDGLSYSLKSLQKTTKAVSVTGKIEGDKFSAQVMSYNKYRLTVYNSKDTLFAENFDIPFTEEENKKIEKSIEIICPEGPKPPKDTSVAKVVELTPKYVFRDIYFEKGSSNLSEDAKRELEIASEILKKNPTAVVAVKGSVQKGENKSLSAKRAQAVYDQLKANGVSNVTVDSNRALNDNSAVLDVKLVQPLVTNFDNNLIAQASVGSSFVLRNLYFETAKADLKQASKSELNVLFNVLTDFPEVSIEIAGHTDSEGADDLNQKLSEKRAKAVIDYLISKGIRNDRLVAKGYGESQQISDNETEKGRKLNRRVEFRILKK